MPVGPIFVIFMGSIVGIYLFFVLFILAENLALKSLQSQWNKILPVKKDVDLIKNKITEINNKIVLFNKLSKDRALWSKRLNALSDSMIPGVWLRRIYQSERTVQSSKEKGQGKNKKVVEEKKLIKYMVIEGSCIAKNHDETAIVGKFIKSLKSNADFFGDFSDIELGTMQSSRQDNAEVFDFELTCYYK